MSDDGRDQQRALYGEPLSDIAARIQGALGLSQAKLADVLGLSAPMLSQLISGHRVKIGNPLVLQRLQALSDLAAEGVPAGSQEARLAQIKDAAPTLTASRTVEADHRAALEALRAMASGQELGRLAGLARDAGLPAALVALLEEAAA